MKTRNLKLTVRDAISKEFHYYPFSADSDESALLIAQEILKDTPYKLPHLEYSIWELNDVGWGRVIYSCNDYQIRCSWIG
jgi:hypothetical protein